jgi:hypothetical protein
VRLPVPKALALIGGSIVNRLARIVSDVNGPVREGRNALRETGTGAQIQGARLAGVDEPGRGDGLVLVARARVRSATTTGSEGRNQNTGNEERSGREESHRLQYRPRAVVEDLGVYRPPKSPQLRDPPGASGRFPFPCRIYALGRATNRWRASRPRLRPNRVAAAAAAWGPRGQCPSLRQRGPRAAWPPPRRRRSRPRACPRAGR